MPADDPAPRTWGAGSSASQVGRLPVPPDAVLFDLDGTLSEAGPAITAAVEVALAHVGRDPLDGPALRSFVGPPLEDGFAALGLPPAVVDDAVRVYRQHYDPLSSPLYDGTVPLLCELRAAGLPLALATSKPQPLAELVVERTALNGLLDIVVGSDRQRGRVTKGDVVGRALTLLGAPAHPVMVGDRSYDTQGAAEHRVPCIGVRWGYAAPGELERSGAAALVGTLQELRDLLLPSS